MAIEDKIPRFNHMCGGWNIFTEKYEGKVIQIVIDEEPFLRFGKGKIHSNMLYELLEECQNAGEPLVEGLDHYAVIDKPFLFKSGKRYKVVGAGLCSISPESKTVEFFGSSLNLHASIDGNHIEKMKKYLPPEFKYTAR